MLFVYIGGNSSQTQGDYIDRYVDSDLMAYE